MTGWIFLLAAALGGYGLLAGLEWSRWPGPAWLGIGFRASLGAGLGIGLTSCAFVLLLWAGLPVRWCAGIASLVIAMTGALVWRRRGNAELKSGAPKQAEHPQPWLWLFRTAGVVAVALIVAGWAVATRASPHGDWDAFSIWNLRAKFLASGQPAWRYAVSPEIGGGQLGAAHPDYPLLLSATVAEVWALNGRLDPEAPAALALLFALLTLGVLVGALTWFRQETLGWLAALLLASSELFGSQVAAQYADIPLAFYTLASVCMLVAGSREHWGAAPLMFAGALAALSAWTKNEGIVFLLLVLAWTAVRDGGRALLRLLAGAAPVLLVVGIFKLVLAPFTVGLFPATASEALAKLSDPARWMTIARAYARTFWEISPWWAHPVLLLALWAWGAGLADRQQRKEGWVLVLPAAMLAADFLVYLLTVADLRWHLDTSCNRLWLQVWPASLLGLFLMVGPWPAATPAAVQCSAFGTGRSAGRGRLRR